MNSWVSVPARHVPAALASETSVGHESSVPAVILWLAITLVATKLRGHFAVKAGQPPVLGALVIGALFPAFPGGVRKDQLIHCLLGEHQQDFESDRWPPGQRLGQHPERSYCLPATRRGSGFRAVERKAEISVSKEGISCSRGGGETVLPCARRYWHLSKEGA